MLTPLCFCVLPVVVFSLNNTFQNDSLKELMEIEGLDLFNVSSKSIRIDNMWINILLNQMELNGTEGQLVTEIKFLTNTRKRRLLGGERHEVQMQRSLRLKWSELIIEMKLVNLFFFFFYCVIVEFDGKSRGIDETSRSKRSFASIGHLVIT